MSWLTVVVCALVFSFMINFAVRSRQFEEQRRKLEQEEWERQSRVGALYGRDLCEESGDEEV